jgi:hypothetical protein
VAEQNLRAACWGIDGVGLVVAASILVLRFLRKGNDYVAAGFLVFAIGEGIILSGTAASLAESGSAQECVEPRANRSLPHDRLAARG